MFRHLSFVWTTIRLPDSAGMIRSLGLGISALAGVFSSDAQRMLSQKGSIRMGDEGKAVGTAQAPAALLSFHNVTIRSVITITEFRVSPFRSAFKTCRSICMGIYAR